MSRAGNRAEQISFDYTVPSQDDGYMQARMAVANGGSHEPSSMRRKRSLSHDEEEDEEGDDDDEYVPHGGDTHGYGGQRYVGGVGQMPFATDQRGGSFDASVEDQRHLHSGMMPSSPSGGRPNAPRKPQGAKAVVLGPDGQPPPKKRRRRQALSCTGEQRLFIYPHGISDGCPFHNTGHPFDRPLHDGMDCP
jgi:hypothetical protein